MFFVVNKPKFQHAISVTRDDRSKGTQGSAGAFMRLEARNDSLMLAGLHVSANIPATVYEPGVLFLKITVLRRLLSTIKGEPFVAIQVSAEELLLDRVRLPVESNEMLLYPDPDIAPEHHPSVQSLDGSREAPSLDRQLTLWRDSEHEVRPRDDNPDA